MNKDMTASIDNAIRSMYQLIALIKDSDRSCVIADCDRELGNIATSADTGQEHQYFADLRAALYRNVHPADREKFFSFTDRDTYVGKLSEYVHISMECRLRHFDSRYYWSEIVLCNTTREDSTEGNDCLLLVRDINERKSAEIEREDEENAVLKSLQEKCEALFEENMKDQQTGCYNRKGMIHYSGIVIDEARRSGRYLFVCVTDLNGLKHLNDTYGHSAGDEAIAAVAHELIRSAPAGSRIVRTGGDEFMIFAAVDKDSPEPGRFDEKLDRGLENYNAGHSNPYTIGASYGWVLLPVKEGMTSLDEYVEMADAKMYEMRIERDKYRRE